MQHILFSIITAFIGINLLAVQAAQEQGKIEFTDYGITTINANSSQTPSPTMPFLETPSDLSVSSQSIVNKGNEKKEEEIILSPTPTDFPLVEVPECTSCEPEIATASSLPVTPTPTPTISIEVPSVIPAPTSYCDPESLKDDPRKIDVCLR